jgi:hypothetical protein
VAITLSMVDCSPASACSEGRCMRCFWLAVNFYLLQTIIRIGQFECGKILPEFVATRQS